MLSVMELWSMMQVISMTSCDVFRDVFEVVWKGQAEAIEKEAAKCLGVKDLRDYFRKARQGRFLGRSCFPLL